MTQRSRTAVLALALILGACAGRDAILSRTLAGLDAAHKTFAVLDERQQLAIVDHADTKEQAVAELAAHRARRNKVQDAFVAAYGAAAVASLDPSDLHLAHLAALAVAALAAVKGWVP